MKLGHHGCVSKGIPSPATKICALQVNDNGSVDVRLFLPFLFAGWVGDIAYRVISDLSDRIVRLESHQADA
jgi:hypothetical protein